MTTSVQTVTSPSRFSWIVGGDRRDVYVDNGMLAIVEIASGSYAIVDDQCKQMYGICKTLKQAQRAFARIMRDLESGFYTRFFVASK